jgi:nitroreductase
MPFKTIAKFGKKKDDADIPLEIYETPRGKDLYEAITFLIRGRRSVRRYDKKDVSIELIKKILESARYAPSAGNYQPWEFIVVKDPEMKKQIAEAAFNQDWLMNAPALIVVCTNSRLAGAIYGDRGLKLYGVQATAAAIQNILLTAESLGLSSCWVGSFSEIIVARILECPEYVRPCAIISMGYSEFKPFAPPRQNIEEFVHLEKFGNSLLEEQVKKEKNPTYMKFQ